MIYLNVNKYIYTMSIDVTYTNVCDSLLDYI